MTYPNLERLKKVLFSFNRILAGSEKQIQDLTPQDFNEARILAELEVDNGLTEL